MRSTDVHELEVAGSPVRVRMTGPEDGVPILLIHGIARALEDWAPAHDLLAQRHRVISADLPGFGFTRRGTTRPSLAAFAEAMFGVLDAADVSEPAYVMGNSLGGGVAMTMAVARPDRVAGLVLVNSVGFGRDVHISPLPMTYAVLSSLPVVGRRFVPLAREGGAQANRNNFFDQSLATEEMIRHYGRVGRQPDFRGTFLTMALQLGIPGLGTWPGWRRELVAGVRATGVPVLVVWGDADAVLPPHHFEAAKRLLPQARAQLFPDTGHMVQYERPVDFVDAAEAFVLATQSED